MLLRLKDKDFRDSHVDESEGDERERDEREGDEQYTIFGLARVAHEWVAHDSEIGEEIEEGLWSERTRMCQQLWQKILAAKIC